MAEEKTLQQLLEERRLAPVSPGRFRVEWISAAEGDKYARVINEMQKVIDVLGKDKLGEEINALKPEMEKRARRMYEAPGVNEASEYSDAMTLAMTVTEVNVGK